jgi:hypothetical protein
MVLFGEIHVFLQLSWFLLFGANRVYFPLEIPACRKYSFEKLTQFSQGNHVLDAPASNPNGSLSRDTCVLSTYLHRPIGRRWAFFHLGNCNLQEIFLSKANSVLIGKQCARCPCFYNTWVSFKRYMCVFNSVEEAYLELHELYSTLKTMICRIYIFRKFTLSSQGHNALDSHSSHSECFLQQIHMFLILAE